MLVKTNIPIKKIIFFHPHFLTGRENTNLSCVFPFFLISRGVPPEVVYFCSRKPPFVLFFFSNYFCGIPWFYRERISPSLVSFPLVKESTDIQYHMKTKHFVSYRIVSVCRCVILSPSISLLKIS